MLVIPVAKNIPSIKQGQTLDGTDYTFRFQWNMRSGWYIGLADSSDTPIFSPRKLVVGVNFLDSVRFDARTPPGDLIAVDVTGQSVDPGYLDLASGASFDDLQGRVIVVYRPVAERV
jgi:hypothetical protein